jgi:hypothetical protein
METPDNTNMPDAAAGGTQPGQPQAATTPPWGTEQNFDPERAWSLIQNLRTDLDKAKSRPVLTEQQQADLDAYQRQVEANKTELQKQAEQTTRWQTEAETWRSQAVSSRVQALAAADFADPSDAASALDVSRYLNAGGEIDEEAIKRDLAELLTQKPHWRRSPEAPLAPRVPVPNPAQGAGGTPAAAGDPRAAFAQLIQSAARR